MPDDPSGVTPPLREWEDPKMVPANEIAAWMDKGWEPCGACLVPATNQDTGQQTTILAYCIRRKFSPVRNVLEGRRIQKVRTLIDLPRANGSR